MHIVGTGSSHMFMRVKNEKRSVVLKAWLKTVDRGCKGFEFNPGININVVEVYETFKTLVREITACMQDIAIAVC